MLNFFWRYVFAFGHVRINDNTFVADPNARERSATASEVALSQGHDGLRLSAATDLQIVNGAQTTASLAAARRDGKTSLSRVFVPMKLSVVSPDLSDQMIPLISRYANSQNAVRASDFFANHPFHWRIQEISRRLLAPAAGSSQVQTHWYYERARGQHVNDQAGFSSSKRDQFLRLNPRNQVITKTDLAKVENCFVMLPDVTCKGAEKSFTEFAERVTKDWAEGTNRLKYGDEWFKEAVAHTIIFRATEKLVSEAPWYEGGYRAQIVAYAVARLAHLAGEMTNGGRLDYQRIWSMQSVGSVLEQLLMDIAERMTGVLRDPPQAGQNISEWAKQQACRKRALETKVPVPRGFRSVLIAVEDARAEQKSAKDMGRVDRGLELVTEVLKHHNGFWKDVKDHARKSKLLTPDDEKALYPVVSMRGAVPTEWQAKRLIGLLERCRDAGFDQ